MAKVHNVGRLKGKAKRVINGINALGKTEDLEALIVEIFPRPGWTTPAEFLLVERLLDSMESQIEVLANLKKSIVQGSRMIGRE